MRKVLVQYDDWTTADHDMARFLNGLQAWGHITALGAFLIDVDRRHPANSKIIKEDF